MISGVGQVIVEVDGRDRAKEFWTGVIFEVKRKEEQCPTTRMRHSTVSRS
jgi:hypothetical protein